MKCPKCGNAKLFNISWIAMAGGPIDLSGEDDFAASSREEAEERAFALIIEDGQLLLDDDWVLCENPGCQYEGKIRAFGGWPKEWRTKHAKD